ncbi:hypothetical protein GWI33_006241 [Rhynchophorus ferrugineus]|uniref:Uncharacterized protein n=1 Tax=Rhynchophorus ferrugineus TaxID=354439 RepID=A0A834MHH9_RHYFE|nr:hypothetical protein GWI33_006241 [Rhynchophorus ferrugineus]
MMILQEPIYADAGNSTDTTMDAPLSSLSNPIPINKANSGRILFPVLIGRRPVKSNNNGQLREPCSAGKPGRTQTGTLFMGAGGSGRDITNTNTLYLGSGLRATRQIRFSCAIPGGRVSADEQCDVKIVSLIEIPPPISISSIIFMQRLTYYAPTDD